MKAISLILVFFLFFLTSCENAQANKNPSKPMVNTETKETAPTKLLRHIVLFKFNEAATNDIVKKIEQKFAGLKNKISEIHSFEWGINNSPEGLDKGLTHCFFVTFLSEEDRTKYLPHPEHQEFVKFIGPFVEDVTVVDYWVQ